MTKAQFNVDMVFEEAQKLGLDFGDLEEYGFDVKSSKCGGQTCIRKENFKDLNDALNKNQKFTKKFKE